MNSLTVSRLFRWFERTLLALLLAVLGTHCLAAQGTSASVTGAVTDTSGANIAGATVTYTNAATGVKASATTNDAGIYRAAGLLPGLYTGSVRGS